MEAHHRRSADFIRALRGQIRICGLNRSSNSSGRHATGGDFPSHGQMATVQCGGEPMGFRQNFPLPSTGIGRGPAIPVAPPSGETRENGQPGTVREDRRWGPTSRCFLSARAGPIATDCAGEPASARVGALLWCSVSQRACLMYSRYQLGGRASP